MSDLSKDLRTVRNFLRSAGYFTSADVVKRALAELERPRAQDVGSNVGSWQCISTAPRDGKPLDLWVSEPRRGAPNGGYREANARWAIPDHTCGEAGMYCDSCPPKGEQWCDEFGRWIELDDEGEGEGEGERKITHWYRPAPPECGLERGLNAENAQFLDPPQ